MAWLYWAHGEEGFILEKLSLKLPIKARDWEKRTVTKRFPDCHHNWSRNNAWQTIVIIKNHV